MPSATEERIRACLIREGLCADDSAGRIATVLTAAIDEGDQDRVTEATFNTRLAQIDATIAQLARDFAERDAERERIFSQHISEMQELERQRDERERQRDERERQRDERERERDAKWEERLRYLEEREARFRRYVYTGMGAGFSGMGLLIALLELFA